MLTKPDTPCCPEAVRDAASELYDDGFYCSEAIIKVVCEACGEGDFDEAVRMATGFGAGMGHSGGACGALTGAIMAASLILGRTDAKGPWRDATSAARELRKRFVAEFGATECPAIISPFGGMRGEGRHEHCRAITGAAAAWVAEKVLAEDHVAA